MCVCVGTRLFKLVCGLQNVGQKEMGLVPGLNSSPSPAQSSCARQGIPACYHVQQVTSVCATSCCAAIILQAPEAGADLKKIETILDGTAPPAEKKVFWTTSLDHTCARGCSRRYAFSPSRALVREEC